MKGAALKACFCLFVVASMVLYPAAARAQGKVDAQYKVLLEKLKSGDTSVDFGELRRAYAESTGYAGDANIELVDQMYSALQKKDYPGAIKVAEKALEANYLDPDAHNVLFMAYRETGQADKAKFHRDVTDGLIRAIFRSGDGKGEPTAYVVNSTREEYILMSIMGLRLSKQSLRSSAGHQFDIDECTNTKTNEKVTLYFNIDGPMRHLAKELKLK